LCGELREHDGVLPFAGDWSRDSNSVLLAP
jgi:hypothetical protein